jgi:UDPglucose 6-dehydrogenase
MTKCISVVGLGKLGLCFAASLAEKGFSVLGVDIDKSVVDAVNEGRSLFPEPGLPALLLKHGGNTLKATISHGEAIESTDITFILVATPSEPDGSFSNKFVESALKSLAEAFGKSSKRYHVFVISSTVMPGSCEASFIPILEKYSGRKLRVDFDVCFDPDFVALGDVIRGYLNPDLVLIGETSSAAGQRVEEIHRQMCGNKPAYYRMALINAELAKVCLNAYITVKISFANSVANLCEKIKGANVDVITRAIGSDKRISPYYFQGGLAFGGTCFPRDTRAYQTIAAEHGMQADILEAVEKVNRFQHEHLLQVVVRELESRSNGSVGVLGLAFTANTPVITESPAIRLVKDLLKQNLRVTVYDPLAMDNARTVLGEAVKYAPDAERCLENVDLAVVCLRSADFKKTLESFRPSTPMTLIDCWRLVDPAKLDSKIHYVAIGQG